MLAWLPVASSKVPEPRPGSCVEDTRELPDRVLNFMRTHPLMDEDVGNQGQAPVHAPQPRPETQRERIEALADVARRKLLESRNDVLEEGLAQRRLREARELLYVEACEQALEEVPVTKVNLAGTGSLPRREHLGDRVIAQDVEQGAISEGHES